MAQPTPRSYCSILLPEKSRASSPSGLFSFIHHLIKSEAQNEDFEAMASRAFFDPVVALRAAPLLTSTCSLWFAWDQHFFLHLFNKPEIRSKSNELLPTYFGYFFRGGVTRVLVLLSLTVSSTLATCLVNHDSHWANGSLRWYTAGMVLAASHLAFVPAIAPKVQAVIEDTSKGQSIKDLDSWLTIHAWRGLTVDLAAWGCFVVATVRNIQSS
ncbi:hypothetical protein THAR02_00895 [Trichoderma harzianum]|uniref:Uncharacterized protein n=1 Tax=Trichoderma harzianum TaxID=5544 RepID=A0A0F9XQW2_TRIHA|nr:hypothetical protein THAR02_00895 [Trichoderma harzianum]